MGRKRGPSEHGRQQREDAAGVSMDAKREIFDYWKTKMQKNRALLDANRQSRIGWAIKNYGMEACRQAIDGCLMSDWHMGKNPNNKAYNDISLIFRNSEKMEMFLDRFDAATKKSAKEQWISGEDK